MKGILFGVILGLLFIGSNLFAADGDLVVYGNVGIGNSTDSGYKLFVDGGLKVNSNGGTQVSLTSGSSTQAVQIAFTKAGAPKWMTGADGPSDSYTLYDAAMNKHAIYVSSNGNLYLYPQDVNSDVNPSETTYPTGNVMIGGWGPPSHRLELATDSAEKPSTNTWKIASDARLKKDVQPYTKGLNEILQINPVTYKYNGKGGVGHNKGKFRNPKTGQDVETDSVDTELLSRTNVGVIAQDIQSVVPESVSSHKGKINDDDADQTDILDFNSHSLTFILINAVKELKAQIDMLNQQIADLKGKAK